MSASDEPDPQGFLTRWSRRKLAPEKARSPDEALLPAALATEAEPGSAPILTPEPEPFDVSLLPSIEDLTGESSVSMFMQAGVPDALKNAALRKIWSANPFIRDDTGPVDYGWNFNDPNSMPGFGPIGENTDIAMLLRQAIGEVEPVLEAPIDIAGEIAPATPSEPMPPVSNTLALVASENEVAMAIVGDTKGIPAAESTLPLPLKPLESGATLPSRRPRHGGAIPA